MLASIILCPSIQGKGKLKNASVRAKQARGLFAKAVIENFIEPPKGLKEMVLEGYGYSDVHSRPLEWFFIR